VEVKVKPTFSRSGICFFLYFLCLFDIFTPIAKSEIGIMNQVSTSILSLSAQLTSRLVSPSRIRKSKVDLFSAVRVFSAGVSRLARQCKVCVTQA